MNKRGTRPDLLFLPIKSSVKNSFSMNFFKFPTNCTKLLRWHIFIIISHLSNQLTSYLRIKRARIISLLKAISNCLPMNSHILRTTKSYWKKNEFSTIYDDHLTKYYIHSFWNCHQRTLASCLPRRHSTRQERTIWQAIRYAFWAQYS